MSQVYFVYASSVNLLKIGRSADPERRLAELRLLSPVPLRVLGVIDGGSQREAELHSQFASLRSHGEWFHATAELLHFVEVEALRAAWERARPEARERFLSDIHAILEAQA